MILAAQFALLLLPQLQAAPARREPPSSPNAAEYRIGPEDVLVVSVWQNAELSRTVSVRPDGKISLPLINDVQAAGLTPQQLRELIIKALREYMPSPEVSVGLSEMNSFKVTVIGEVKRPDRYRLRAPATVLDLLAQAGGFQDWANRERIVVLRPRARTSPGNRASAEFERIPFDYKKVTGPGGEAGNIAVQPDDIIVVP
jgi:polysaccharide export outer membrane protein